MFLCYFEDTEDRNTMNKKNADEMPDETVLEFDALIHKADDMDAAWIEIPYDIEQIWGKKRVKVHVMFDGIPYDGLALKMGTEQYIVGLRKDIRRKAGKQPGDFIHAVITKR